MTVCCLCCCSSSETGWPQEAIDRGRRDVTLQAVARGGGGGWSISTLPAQSRKKRGALLEIWELLNLGSEGREGG